VLLSAGAEGDRHGATSFTNYRQVHDARMQGFVDAGFVTSHTLAFGSPRHGHITLTGEVRCLGPITIRVDKKLKVLKGKGPSWTVRTVEYRYHAQADGRGSLFRYCSPHGSGHRPCHHVHRYDVFDTWAELLPVEEIWNGNDVPTLSDVIEEAQDLYYRDDF
jgi:hypothetical protein